MTALGKSPPGARADALKPEPRREAASRLRLSDLVAFWVPESSFLWSQETPLEGGGCPAHVGPGVD